MMIVYLFDGNFEGYLTCIYYSYYDKKKPELFIDKNCYIPNFTYELTEIETEKDKYERVYNSLEEKVLNETLTRIYYLFLSSIILLAFSMPTYKCIIELGIYGIIIAIYKLKELKAS